MLRAMVRIAAQDAVVGDRGWTRSSSPWEAWPINAPEGQSRSDLTTMYCTRGSSDASLGGDAGVDSEAMM